MPLTSFFTALEILLPALFVLGIGFWAGHAKRFDDDQVAGLNDLVLTFALPALLFVSIARASRDALFSEVPFVLALLVAGIGLFAVVALLSIFVLRRRLGAAAVQAATATLPNVAFIGTAILTPLFGIASHLSIAIAALVTNVTIVPSMVTMLEYDRNRAVSNAGGGLGSMVAKSLADSFKQPFVSAPVLALVLVLIGVHVPREIDTMLALVGSATAGVSLFVSGLIVASFPITISLEAIGNTLIKVVVQPAIMALLAMMLAIVQPLRGEAILITALSTAVIPPMLAVRYKVYQAEAAATFLLATLAMVITLPIAVWLAR